MGTNPPLPNPGSATVFLKIALPGILYLKSEGTCLQFPILSNIYHSVTDVLCIWLAGLMVEQRSHDLEVLGSIPTRGGLFVNQGIYMYLSSCYFRLLICYLIISYSHFQVSF